MWDARSNANVKKKSGKHVDKFCIIHCKKWLILEYLKTLKNLKHSVTKYRGGISTLKYFKLVEFEETKEK